MNFILSAPCIICYSPTSTFYGEMSKIAVTTEATNQCQRHDRDKTEMTDPIINHTVKAIDDTYE